MEKSDKQASYVGGLQGGETFVWLNDCISAGRKDTRSKKVQNVRKNQEQRSKKSTESLQYVNYNNFDAR